MKTGWKIRPLGELCRIELGSTPARDNPAMWDDTRETNNVWLSIADLPQQLHAVARDSKEYVSNRAAATMKLVPAGTLLVSFKLTLGRLAYADRELFTNEAIAALLDLNAGELDKEYLYWYLTFFDWNQAAEGEQKIKGKTLNKAKLNLLPVRLPPLEEQQRIVAILDEVFEGVIRARANAEANLKDARALFSAALGSVFTENIERWPLRRLADVSLDFGRGKSRHRPRNDPRLYGGDTPLIQTGDISRADHFLRSYSQTYSLEGVAQSRIWPKGTVCVAIVGATIGESAILDFDACFPDSVIGIIPDPNSADPEFLEYLLQFVKSDLKEAGKGSARDNINLATFTDRLFPIPDLSEQKRAVEFLAAVDLKSRELVAAYGWKLNQYDVLRQAILEKAFSGELF